MSIKIDSRRLLDLLGENGEHWLKGGWNKDEQMCLHGAIRRCSPQLGDAFLIEQVAAKQSWGTDWNDDEQTNWPMVRERIVAGIEVTDDMLADTFGSQWEHVVALVRRVAVLTADDVQRMNAAAAAAAAAAKDAANAVPWFAARKTAAAKPRPSAAAAAAKAARAAVRDNARASAGVAAWDAAQAAAAVDAWAVAQDMYRDIAADNARAAAWALVVRDRIGQQGFTQEHYKIGRAHV